MALKAWDSFGGYNSPSSDMLSRSGWLQWTASNCTLASPGPLGWGKYLVFSSGGGGGNEVLTGSFASNLATFYIGQRLNVASGNVFLVRAADLSTGFSQFVVELSAATAQVSILAGSTGTGGGSVLATTGNNVFAVGTSMYLEVGGTIASSGGSVTVKINGVQVLTFSGNTQASANAWINGIQYRSAGSAFTTTKFSDFYVCDSTVGPGTFPCNTFLGDVTAYPRFATANSVVAWTPLANTNWQEVSETAMDSDTSYNSSATPGQEDLFTFGTLPAQLSTIIAVGVVGAYRKDNSGSRTLAQLISSQGTVSDGASDVLNTGYAYFQDIFPTDPATGASWTYAHANAAIAGYSLIS